MAESLAFSYEDAERAMWQAVADMTPSERLEWLIEAIEMVRELQESVQKPIPTPEPMGR